MPQHKLWHLSHHFLSDSCQIIFESDDEFIGVHTVNGAGLLKIFTAGHSTAHAVHTDRLENRHSLRCIFNDFRNKGFSGDFLDSLLLN